VQFTGSDHTVTSISLKFWTRAANVTLRLQVFRSDSATVPPAQNEVDTKLVFEEHVPMTNLARVQRDGTRSTWDGTLSPAAWDGGCQDALYRVKTTLVLEDGSTSGDGYTPWFRCTGPNVVPHRPFPN
jgi:hypothetical protein